MMKKLLLTSLLLLLPLQLCFGAVVIGTNAGFLTVAPVDDPDGSAGDFAWYAFAQKYTTPATAITVTEIGWWCNNATDETNFEVGIYNDNSGEVGTLVASSVTNAKGTTAGWKKASGLSIALNASTVYWIATQADSTSPQTQSDYAATGGIKRFKNNATALTDPWGTSDGTSARIQATYALYTTAGSSIKTINGLAKNSCKTWNGLAIASVKSVNGLQ